MAEWHEKLFGEEERRLAYVALSRPKDVLVVSFVLQVAPP